MEQQNNTIKNRKGKHLTREERQQIETVRRAGSAAKRQAAKAKIRFRNTRCPMFKRTPLKHQAA